MFVASLLPAAAKFVRQIVPPVVATLIAAVLIASYNSTFSGHLTQPRMAAMHAGESAAQAAPAPAAKAVTPAAVPATKGEAPVTEVITIHEVIEVPERLTDKDARQDAGKDQPELKVAAVEPATPQPSNESALQRAAAALERTAPPAPRSTEQRRVAAVEHSRPAPAPVVAVQPMPAQQAPVVQQVPQQHAPMVSAPPMAAPVVVMAPNAAPVAHEPPPVIAASPPMVTVPDKPRAARTEQVEPEAEAQAPARREGAFGVVVNNLKPSTWFARAREFGEKLEQVGNDILPNIRPQ